MLIGILWAVLAPGLLVIAIGLIAYCIRGFARRAAVAMAAGVVLIPVSGIWLVDHAEFAGVCERETKGIIRSTARADGVLLNSPTANSFGTRYLYDEGFSWFEAPDIYNRGRWVRYEKNSDDKIAARPIEAPQARYEVKEGHSTPFAHTGLSIVSIIDKTDGAEISRAGSAQFDGGRVKWVLGAWGAASCPSAMTDEKGFRAYYHLARDTLRR